MKNIVLACRALLVTILFLLFILASGVFAQDSRATISGAVLDPAGAAVPSAAITITEVRTGAETHTKSNAAGEFNVPFLLPGEYQLQAEAPGFRTFVRRGITLASIDHAVINVNLVVGQANQTVNVTGEAPLLDVANAAVGQTITTQQVEDFPLNGRTPMMLAALSVGVLITPTPGNAPGQVHPFDNNAAAGWSIGGTPAQNNELLTDGSPNAIWSGSLAYSPPQDAVQEVTVKAFDNDATYGHTIGGTLNQVLKTGTNSFHGSLYDFSQVSALDANNYFNARAGKPNPVTHYNQYGLTAGGPVLIPKVFNGKDKLFWFFAWENLNDSQPTTNFATVPTDAERNGDFSALLALGSQYQIYNPFSGTQSGKTITRQPFQGNIIQPINSIAQAYLKFYPEPNTTGTAAGQNNYISSAPSVDTFDNELGRLDYNMSDRDKLFFDIRHNYRTQIKNNFFNNQATGVTLTRLNWGTTLDNVYSFNPTTILDVRANWTYFGEVHGSPSSGFNPTALGFPSNIASNSTLQQMPLISFGSCGSQTSFQCLGDNGSSQVPSQSYQLFTDLVKVIGKHSFKFGFDGRRYNLDAITFGNSVGNYTFGTSWTQGPTSTSAAAPFGQDFASFLLGLPTAGSYDINTRTALHQYYFAGFVQDDWRLSPTLTLNLGVRFDHNAPYIEAQGRTVSGFAFNTPNPVAAAAQAAYAKNPNPLLPVANFNVNGGLLFPPPSDGAVFQTDSHMFSPRIGFAWSPAALNQKTVIRGGFGMFVAPVTVANLASTGTFSSNPILNTQGFSATTTQVVTNNTFLSPATSLSNPFPNGISQPTGSSLGLATFNGQTVSFFAPNIKDPYSLRWNIGVQHSITNDLLVEVDYMGNHGVHLPVAATQFNVIPRQFLSALPNRDPNAISALTATTANPFAGLLPSTSINGSMIAVSQLLAAYPSYPQGSGSTSTGVIEQNNTIGSSYFESLDARVEKRFSRGLALIGTYEFSKLIEAVTFLNDTDNQLYRRLSPYDHPHHFVAAATYELPAGRGKALDLESGWANALFGGWVINGIYTFQVGQPVVWSSGDYALCSQPTAQGTNNSALKGLCADENGNLLAAATSLPANLNYDPRQTVGTAFNTSFFVTGAAPSASTKGLTAAQIAALQQTGQLQFHIRTFPQTFGNMRQDGINNIDASVLKNFHFTESTYLQLRFEAFNVFNHPQFGLPNVTPTNSTFGTITAQSNLPRQIQLGARFVF